MDDELSDERRLELTKLMLDRLERLDNNEEIPEVPDMDERIRAFVVRTFEVLRTLAESEYSDARSVREMAYAFSRGLALLIMPEHPANRDPEAYCEELFDEAIVAIDEYEREFEGRSKRKRSKKMPDKLIDLDNIENMPGIELGGMEEW